MAIEQRSDDAAIQNPGECFVFGSRLPFRHQLISFHEAAYVQPARIRRTATKTRACGRIEFLHALGTVLVHAPIFLQGVTKHPVLFAAMTMGISLSWILAGALLVSSCAATAPTHPQIVTVAMDSGPTNLDPRVGTD